MCVYTVWGIFISFYLFFFLISIPPGFGVGDEGYFGRDAVRSPHICTTACLSPRCEFCLVSSHIPFAVYNLRRPFRQCVFLSAQPAINSSPLLFRPREQFAYFFLDFLKFSFSHPGVGVVVVTERHCHF